LRYKQYKSQAMGKKPHKHQSKRKYSSAEQGNTPAQSLKQGNKMKKDSSTDKEENYIDEDPVDKGLTPNTGH
jgi:hypothetical protein